ncbi:MAG: hypothetical protein HS116_17905 [Planctomycetes bacterium]|nr:hypothetical protein [Planctomycetota bacterium]
MTLSGSGGQFECDANAKTATLALPGGKLVNAGATAAYIQVESAAPTAADTTAASNIKLPANMTWVYELPPTCLAFKFVCASSSTLLVYFR